MLKNILEYTDVGTIVYSRPRINKPPAVKFVSVTVLQLLVSGLVQLNFDEVTNKAKCCLGMIAERPAYLNNDYWHLMYLVDNWYNINHLLIINNLYIVSYPYQLILLTDH